MKKCDCKIMNTLGKYQKIWPWIGVAGYAIDGAEAVLKHTKWGKAHYKLRMLIHGAGAGLLCLGAGVHTVQAFATGKTDVPAVVSGSVIGSGILGLNYTPVRFPQKNWKNLMVKTETVSTAAVISSESPDSRSILKKSFADRTEQKRFMWITLEKY